jgi:hypothetical protein
MIPDTIEVVLKTIILLLCFGAVIEGVVVLLKAVQRPKGIFGDAAETVRRARSDVDTLV